MNIAISSKGIQSGYQRSPNISLGREDVVECGILGRGACGVVIRAFSYIHNGFVALKKIDAFEAEKRKQIFKEITTMLKVFPADAETLNDPEELPVIGFYGAFYDSQSIYLALQCT